LITLYVISNCDAVRKAKQYLTAQSIDFHYHDFRKDGLIPELVSIWLKQVAADKLVNRGGTALNGLTQADQAGFIDSTVNDDSSEANQLAITIIVSQPTLVKRPVLVSRNGEPIIGFCESSYRQLANA